MHPVPELSLPLALLIVFGAAKVLAEIFERLHQPGIAGEILAGVLVGPSVLGLIAPNPTLSSLADLGVMFLLFGVGLEVKATDLVKAGGTATLVAAAGVVVPFFAGWGLMAAWGATLPEAIFVGASLVATSVGITASVLSARGLLQEIASRVILAAAVIDDVLGLIVLAAVSALARGGVNLWELGLTATLASTFTVIVAYWGTRAVNRVAPRVEAHLRAGEAQFHLAMILMFALAVLASYTGVAAIIGAFLAGMALSETAEARVRDLSRGVNELLVPFFLAGIGLQLDVRVFMKRSTLLLALAILLLAILTKLVGCGLGALSLGRSNALKIGLGMVPRGEVGMVVAQIGLSLAVVSADTYAVVVFMAVATTVAAPLLLRWAYRN
jgi:Kef-type K+ transport system membrane component KefB